MNEVVPIACVIQSEFDYEPFCEEVGSFSTFALARYRSGEEALRELRASSARRPHLLIVAYDLPVMHGGFFASQCRRLPEMSNVPIILLVPRGCDDDVRWGLQADGLVQIVELTADRSEWVQRVRAILGYWAVVRWRH